MMSSSATNDWPVLAQARRPSQQAKALALLETAKEKRLYRLSFGLRCGAGLAAWLLTMVFNISFMEDALNYDRLARGVAEDWSRGQSSEWMSTAIQTGQAWFMVGTLAVFYLASGGLQVLPLLIVAFCGITAWTPVLIYRIVRKLGFPSDAAYVSGLLVAVTPAFAFWSSALYKEGLILLVMSLQIYHMLNLQEEFSWKSLTIVLVGLPVLFGLRFYLAMMMAAVVVGGLCSGRGQQIVQGRRRLRRRRSSGHDRGRSDGGNLLYWLYRHGEPDAPERSG